MKFNDKEGNINSNNKTSLNKVNDHNFGLVYDYPILKISKMNIPNAIVLRLKVKQNKKIVNFEWIS